MMKKLLSCKKTALVLVIVTLLFAAFYAYMLVRPISYGMDYRNETVYEGGSFVGTIEFRADRTMVNRNTNFDEEMKSRYYYKDGYVFFTMAETDEAYEKEIAMIDENFEEAIKMPFYSNEISAFRMVASEGDDFETVYTCTPAIVFAIVGGVIELALMAVSGISLLLSFKKRSDAEAAGALHKIM